MTEYDGLTDARAEAERRYPDTLSDGDIRVRTSYPHKKLAFVSGAEWATEREKARAEAAEARVAELEEALSQIASRTGIGRWRNADAAELAGDICEVATRALTAPTTEAVTEVEGS